MLGPQGSADSPINDSSCRTVAPSTCRLTHGRITFALVLFVLLAAPIASALETPWEAIGPEASAVQAQQLNCSRIPSCEQCFLASSDDSITQIVCRTCKLGYRPAAEGSSCGKQIGPHYGPASMHRASLWPCFDAPCLIMALLRCTVPLYGPASMHPAWQACIHDVPEAPSCKLSSC